jgi:sulfite reductase alpha subunit-like flavoprotein
LCEQDDLCAKAEAQEITIFMMATYGEGDPTDNAITFMKWLGKHAEKHSLDGLRYAVGPSLHCRRRARTHRSFV